MHAMDNQIPITANTSQLTQQFREASIEINRIAREEIAPAATLIDDAFADAARSITSELGRAARTGELSLKSLAQALARDLGNSAIDSLVRKPLNNLLSNLFSAPFGGARANGGFVAPGQSFLVGERGPELFSPGASGQISPGMGAPVNVSITLPGVRDTAGFQKSQTQIAAAMARALSRGARNG